jgi:hypothetical protein
MTLYDYGCYRVGPFFDTAVGRADAVVSETTTAHTEEGDIIQESDLGSRVI